MKNPTIILEHVARIARFKQITHKGDLIRLKEYAEYMIKEIDKKLAQKETPPGFYFALTHTRKEVAKLRRKSKPIKNV